MDGYLDGWMDVRESYQEKKNVSTFFNIALNTDEKQNSLLQP